MILNKLYRAILSILICAIVFAAAPSVLCQDQSAAARAAIRDDDINMETQLYYRPNDLTTARYLEERLGSVSAYAHSQTLHSGEETSEGRSERPIPLVSSQDYNAWLVFCHRQFLRPGTSAHLLLTQIRVPVPPLYLPLF